MGLEHRVATCTLCRDFHVPWGDYIGSALMRQHQETDCPGAARPYVPGEHGCCCGDPACTDFEDRMADAGIPLDEIEVVEFTLPIKERRRG